MSDAYRGRSVNVVLVKDDVGRAKRTCYDLPHEGHAFGKSEEADLEGAREVTMHWAAHVPRPKPVPDAQDFRKINKLATRVGVSNAKDLATMRKGTDIKLIPSASVGPLPKVIPSDVIPAFAYGRKSRPSTPIASVVGYHYATEYEEALSGNYDQYQSDSDMANSKLKVRLTKKSTAAIAGARGRRAMEESGAPPKPVFCLSKFKNVKGKCGFAEMAGAPVAKLPNDIARTMSLPNL